MEFQRLQATSEAEIAKSTARTKAAQKDLAQVEKVSFPLMLTYLTYIQIVFSLMKPLM